MDKIKLEICCGTTCYMLGGDKLLQLDKLMHQEWHDKVEISASPCMEECVAEKMCEAPVVRINGKVHGNATAESVCAAVSALLAGEEGAEK